MRHSSTKPSATRRRRDQAARRRQQQRRRRRLPHVARSPDTSIDLTLTDNDEDSHSGSNQSGMEGGGNDRGAKQVTDNTVLAISLPRIAEGGDLMILQEFLTMWKACESDTGLLTHEIESGPEVRRANHNVAREDSSSQRGAQYGRMLPFVFDKILRILQVKRDEIFVDAGHGIGSLVIHAAFTIGCESRGLEMCHRRHSISTILRLMCLEVRKIYEQRDDRNLNPGLIKLEHGELQDPQHRPFLTTDGDPDVCIKAFCNNFNDVLSKDTVRGQVCPSDCLAALFATMNPGSVLATMYPLNVGAPRSQVNHHRKKHKLLPSDDASFYEVKEINLGPQNTVVSWSEHGGSKRDVTLYVYERVRQTSKSAVFLCSNSECASYGTPIPAVRSVGNGEGERLVMNHCQCRQEIKSTRQRRAVVREF